ncbi:GntR family transcriptional regulator [Ktedonobacter racemifer]|uniref:Transcriptional regulator, GntR family n=1 Tax=Ktedonobacter racemifer DSM 44963 TaxID=485913 RepID=D6U8S4_KTERA|nr:GntR family transcriptional regulator [Ktedonobacter racemifer]EFH79634.1 transcriptional regulator, GntR family [Ktedonobacter racemifer DSM 44963]
MPEKKKDTSAKKVDTASKVNYIVETLKTEIESGMYGQSGAGIIPSRNQLKDRFSVSPETVGRAILHLRAMGLVEAQPKGRHVLVGMLNLKLPGVTSSFDRYLTEQGLTPEMANVGTPEVISLEGSQAARFRLPAGTQAIKRLRLQGAKRQNHLSWYRLAETYYLRELVRDEWLEAIRQHPKFVLIDAIKEATGKQITHAHSELITRFPNPDEQSLLEITFQTPVVEHYRMCYADDDTLIMFNRIVAVANKFTFEFDYPISM